MTIHTKMLRELEDSQGNRLILDDVMDMAAFWFQDSINELEDETDEDSKKAVENYKEALILIDNFKFLTGF
jgi:hypothetical protein